jgi:D-serine deaminase-like pyridoxal phosphate-dependent protein
VPGEGGLDPALAIYAQVLSTPEPGLAIAGMGKRDAPFDEGLPVAENPGLTVTRLNDHHTYLAVAEGVQVAVGDVLRFGISHPCTAFDKWRWIPVVDDAGVVVDVLSTCF